MQGNLFSLDAIFLIIALLINVVLVFLIYKQGRNVFINKLFIALCLLSSLWLLVLFFDSKIGPSLHFARLSIFIATPLSFSFFLLAESLPGQKLDLSKGWLVFWTIATFFVMLFNLTPFTFTHIEVVEGARKVIPSFGLIPFALLSTIFSVTAIYILVKKYKKISNEIARLQIRFVIGGIFGMLSLVTFTILLPIVLFNNDKFLPLAPLYVLFFLILTAFAILKYQLFNIKVIATEALVITLVIVLFSEGLLSGSLFQIIYKFVFSLIITLLGRSLIRSVHREIKQREELSNLAESLEKANLRLQELDRQKTEFLSIASHQLRTPLSIIKGYIELIEDGAYGKPTKKMDHILEDMDESNEHLVKLVDEFLDITRIEQGRTKYTFEQKDMVHLIDGVVKELKEKADEKKMRIKWKPLKGDHTVTMDEEKIRHVVFNFVDNAIKYSQKGAVEVVMDKGVEEITVRVKDQGLGFGPEDQANFFQKFYRGENVKGTNVNGTGLGIYVCRMFVEAHGGKVWAKSEGLGKGSEFGFQIPNKPVNNLPTENLTSK